jgi:hypothetical protein
MNGPAAISATPSGGSHHLLGTLSATKEDAFGTEARTFFRVKGYNQGRSPSIAENQRLKPARFRHALPGHRATEQGVLQAASLIGNPSALKPSSYKYATRYS